MNTQPGVGYTFTNLGSASSLEITSTFQNLAGAIMVNAKKTGEEDSHPFKISVGYNYLENGDINLSHPYKISLSPGHIQNLVPQNIGYSISNPISPSGGEYGVYVKAGIDGSNLYPSPDGPQVYWGVKEKEYNNYCPENDNTFGHILIGTVKIEGTPPASVFTINQMVKSSQMTERIKFSNEASGVRYYFNRV